MQWFRVGFVCGWIVLWLSCQTHGQSVMSSYIAGFERFATHGDIDSLQSGSLLVRELSCTACHPAGQSWLKPKRGPQLDDVATRLSVEWIEAYVRDPAKVAPGTTMPDVLVQIPDNERPGVVRSLVAFLSTLRSSLPEVKGSGLLPVPHEFWLNGDANRGQQLFHQVGCVACHATALVDGKQDANHSIGDAIHSEPSNASASQEGVVAQHAATALDNLLESLDAEQLAEMGLTNAARAFPSAPLTSVDRKYGVEGLTHFLLDPLRWRPSGRMPNLKLSPVEAADIAAYLMRRGDGRFASSLSSTDRNGSGANSSATSDQEIANGRKWFLKLGCAQCHSAAGVLAEVIARPLSSLNMTGKELCRDSHGRPLVKHALTDAQIETIAALVPKLEAEVPWSSADALAAQLLSLNCLACHVRDGLGGVGRYRREYFGTVGNVDLGDEGRFPPPLDRIGQKLQPGWLKNVLLGRKADIRPHLQIRMPVFSSESAQSLTDLFVAIDGPPSKPVGIDKRLEGATLAQAIDVGKQLMDAACVQCHVFKGQALPGVIGVDVVGLENRLRPEWFHEFLKEPGQLKPRTRMPTFFADGKSPRPDLLNGNVDHQINAMWAYLNSKDFALPAKIQETRDRDFELRPGDKPIVMRTFVEGVGYHAIAVGYPSGVHIAFDAQRMQVAIGWKGRFMDAQGTWFSRFAPPAAPLGDRTVRLMSGLPIGRLGGAEDGWPKEPVGYRFLGYKLDQEGVPTFRYRCGKIEIEDRCDSDSEGLTRRLRLTNLAKESNLQSYLLLHSGANLKMLDTHTAIDDKGVAISVKLPSNASMTEERHDSETSHWLMPITLTVTELELRYRW